VDGSFSIPYLKIIASVATISPLGGFRMDGGFQSPSQKKWFPFFHDGKKTRYLWHDGLHRHMAAVLSWSYALEYGRVSTVPEQGTEFEKERQERVIVETEFLNRAKQELQVTSPPNPPSPPYQQYIMY
jgi:hypothetical protein